MFWSSDGDQTTDLEAALGFVIRRIEEQAEASGQALNEDEHPLLENLARPHKSIILSLQTSGLRSLFPRNLNLERLCALAKAAYLNDRKTNSGSLHSLFVGSTDIGCGAS